MCLFSWYKQTYSLYRSKIIGKCANELELNWSFEMNNHDYKSEHIHIKLGPLYIIHVIRVNQSQTTLIRSRILSLFHSLYKFVGLVLSIDRFLIQSIRGLCQKNNVSIIRQKFHSLFHSYFCGWVKKYQTNTTKATSHHSNHAKLMIIFFTFFLKRISEGFNSFHLFVCRTNRNTLETWEVTVFS